MLISVVLVKKRRRRRRGSLTAIVEECTKLMDFDHIRYWAATRSKVLSICWKVVCLRLLLLLCYTLRPFQAILQTNAFNKVTCICRYAILIVVHACTQCTWAICSFKGNYFLEKMIYLLWFSTIPLFRHSKSKTISPIECVLHNTHGI